MVGQISSTLTITLKKQAEDYTIEASGTKEIKVDPQLAPQLKTLLSDQQITDTLKDLSSQTAPATTDAIQKLGKALYDSLFTDRDLLLAFGKAQGSASSDSGTRLRLQIEPIELAVLPWETMHDGKDWLSAQSTTPLVRKIALSNNRKPLQKLQVRGALRILFIGASPENLDPLKVEETADELETLLGGAIKKKQIVFDKLLNATLEDLQQGLLKDYHILYVAGHGSPEGIFLDDGQGDDIEKEGKVIGRERGDKSLVSAETLAQALKGKQTRLVFLAACETSKTSGGSRLLRGFAQELAERSNLPAIVAMQYFISDMQANPLTTQFFAALAAGRPVDVAMAEARTVLMKKGQVNRDVFSPVLYLQAEDGALFPKAKNWPAISAATLAVAFSIVAGYQLQQAQRQRVEQWASNASAGNQPLNAAINAIAATGLSQSAFVQFPNYLLSARVEGSLMDAVWENPERNRLFHESSVNSVAFSPDGKRIVSGSSDNTVRVWDASSGRLIGKPFQGHEESVNSVVFSPDGKRIASGSSDNTVRVWDASSGRLIGKPFQGHENSVNSVAFSPDGKRIVSGIGIGIFGSSDNTVRVWDASSGQPIGKPFQGHEESVNSVAFSPDGKQIVSGSSDGTVRVWDASSGRPIGKPFERVVFLDSVAFSPDGKQIVGGGLGMAGVWDVSSGRLIARFVHDFYGESLVNSVAFSPDGKRIVSGSSDKTVQVWDASRRRPIGKPFQGHEDVVNSVAFSPDGKRIVSGSNDGTVRMWDASRRRPIGRLFQGHEESVNSVVFSPDGKRIASGSSDKTVRVWDASSGQLIGKPFQGHEESVNSVAFSPDGKQIVSGSSDKTVRVWDASSGRPIGKPLQKNASVNSVAFSPDGKRIVSGSSDKTVQVWDASSGRPIGKPFQGHEHSAFSPDGKRIVSDSSDGTVRVWDASSGRPISKPFQVGDSINLAFSPDGERIVSQSFGGMVRVWDASSGQPIGTPFQGHESSANLVAFSPDGKQIVSSSFGSTVRVWDVSSGRPIGKPFQDFWGEDVVNSVAFSPDGKRIVSGSREEMVRVWDASSGQPIGTPFWEHESSVNSVAFSPDGKQIVSGSSDKTVRVWDISGRYLLQVACTQLRHHPSLAQPANDVEKEANQTCQHYVWKP